MNCSIYYCALNSKTKNIDAEYREIFTLLKIKKRLLFYTTSLTVYHKDTMVYYIYKQEKQKYVFFLGLNGVIDCSIKDIFSFFEELQSIFNLPFHNNEGVNYLKNLKLVSAIVDYGFLNSWAIHKLREHNFVKCSFPSYTAIENSSAEKSFDNIAKYKLISKDIVEVIKTCSLVYVYNISEDKKIKWNDWVCKWDKETNAISLISIVGTIAIYLFFIGSYIYKGGWEGKYIFTIPLIYPLFCLVYIIVALLTSIFYGISYIISLQSIF